MTIVFKDVVEHDWGWLSGDDQRMHIQTLDSDSRFGDSFIRITLEDKGRRTCEVSKGQMSGPDLEKLRAEVEEHREDIEDRWIGYMLAKRWLAVSRKGRVVTLTAYPGEDVFSRKLDLGVWYPGAYTRMDSDYCWDNRKIYVDLAGEYSAVAVGPEEEVDDREFIRISDILFQDELFPEIRPKSWFM